MTLATMRCPARGVLQACLVAAAMSGFGPRRLPAQGVEGGRPALVSHGKWAALGTAVAATALGIRANRSADRHYESLRRYCGTVGPCAVGADGRYPDAGAEAIWMSVVRNDRRARAWLVTGQAALVGATVLFVLDLRNRGRPGNEPLTGLYVSAGAFATNVGIRLTLP
jgi:hypothetical protein